MHIHLAHARLRHRMTEVWDQQARDDLARAALLVAGALAVMPLGDEEVLRAKLAELAGGFQAVEQRSLQTAATGSVAHAHRGAS